MPFFTAAFLAITGHAGRPDLAAYAIVGAAVIGIWSSALYVSGEIIETERFNGTLEGIVATPAPLAIVVLGRIAVTTAVSFLGLAESVAVAAIFFGQRIVVHHGVLFAVALISAWAAMVGTATIMSGLFVLARSVRTFQNSLSYPFYLLSGAVVPVALLPGVLQPLSRVVFLSWVTDLLRACLRPETPTQIGRPVAATLILAAIGFGAGLFTINRVLHRIRHLGTVPYT